MLANRRCTSDDRSRDEVVGRRRAEAKTSVRSSQPFPKLDLCLVFLACFGCRNPSAASSPNGSTCYLQILCPALPFPIKLAMALLRSKFRIRWDDDIVALTLV